MRFHVLIYLLLSLLFFKCAKKKSSPYKAEHVIIVVIDGTRYSESWGEPTQQFIPHQKNLKSQGVFFNNFYNNGVTSTVPGHAAITTGVYENIDNNGTTTPSSPSLFQAWLKKYQKPENTAYIIASKDKLEVLNNCTNPIWNNKYQPLTNCGWSGLGSGYRPDSITMNTVISILENNSPNMVLINFRQPDFSAHQNDWNGYIAGIQQTDLFVNQLWEYIQSNSTYTNKTALFITNDHGRHLDSNGGFAYHGDDCEGCRRISLLAIGPDFNQGMVVNEAHELIDVSTTIAKLMNFKFSTGNGKELSSLFK